MSNPSGLRAGVERLNPETLEDFAALHDAIDHTLNRATAKLLREAADDLRALLAKHRRPHRVNLVRQIVDAVLAAPTTVQADEAVRALHTASPPSEPSPVEQE